MNVLESREIDDGHRTRLTVRRNRYADTILGELQIGKTGLFWFRGPQGKKPHFISWADFDKIAAEQPQKK